MSSIARNLAVSITDYIKVNSSTTLPVPTPYGHIVVDFTGATGTLTFPDMSNVDAGGLITVRKSNETQGEVTNDPGLNPIITGSVVPRQYSDGDFFTYMWDGDRLVLVDGYETGENANGDWVRVYNREQKCITSEKLYDGIQDSSAGYIFRNSNVQKAIYPIEFFSIKSAHPYIISAHSSSQGLWACHNAGGGTTTSFSTTQFHSLDVYSMNSISGIHGAAVSAVGTWY